MAATIDFEFYELTFGGAAVAMDEFQRLAQRASEVIDELTFDRAAPYFEIEEPTVAEAELIEKIKMATCAVIEALQTIENGGGVGAIASERVGSYVVTFADNPSRQMTEQARLSAAAKRYLGRTGLMYRGFLEDEYGYDTL